jgi:hypothetical protein
MPYNFHIDDAILKEIADALSAIKYGEMVITVHDSQVVQIEKREKKRFTLKGGQKDK